MADSIKIKLDTSRYRIPTQEDISAAKEYILQREESARAIGDEAEALLSRAAEEVVKICYKYDADPKKLLFSSAFNEEMMNEISDVMDDLEGELLALIERYVVAATKDNSFKNFLLAWMATLGKNGNGIRETLDGYLYKTMKDWEAAIAAMRYMGLTLSEALVRIKTYLRSIYSMPEVQTAFRHRTEFASTYIYYGGVQRGAVGISNNGSTNVVNMGRITVQMAWMRAQMLDFQEKGAAGYLQLRGSLFDCDLCDEETGFHEGLEDMEVKAYPHPNCRCYRVPVYWKS